MPATTQRVTCWAGERMSGTLRRSRAPCTALAPRARTRHHATVNLLLLEPDEVGPDGEVVLRERRAAHLVEVLKAAPGQVLQTGVVDGDLGEAEVITATAGEVRLRIRRLAPPPPATGDVLLLAVPRPKVLLRMLELAAALGYGEIALFRSWRVDKSHLESQAMLPEVQQEHLRLGLEQARRTRLPRIRTFLRFRPFVEDDLPQMALPAHRFCAHPPASVSTAELQLSRAQPFALAIGPEGGFLPWEVEQLARAGFTPVRMHSHPLRTESALAAMHAQLDLLRRRQ